MGKIIKFNDMNSGETYDTFFLINDLINKGLTKSGSPYVSMIAFDGEREKTINLWNSTVERLAKDGINKGVIIAARVSVIEKEGKQFINIAEGEWGINSDPNVTEKDFVHCAPIDAEKAFSYILEEVFSSAQEYDSNCYDSIAKFTVKLLKANKEAFIRSSAAVKMHHNCLGGLVYHTFRMIRMAKSACETYDILDKELMLCGTALHDIEKIVCYETTDIGTATMSVEGNLWEHSAEGVFMIRENARTLGCCCDPERLKLLEHMVASHQGKREWGALNIPAIPEAMALHFIDTIDARIYMFEDEYRNQNPGTVSKERNIGLDGAYAYKPEGFKECSEMKAVPEILGISCDYNDLNLEEPFAEGSALNDNTWH